MTLSQTSGGSQCSYNRLLETGRPLPGPGAIWTALYPPVSQGQLRIGDVITFGNGGRIVVHGHVVRRN